MKFTNNNTKLESNLTSLVDIIFTVLIFFIVLFRFSTFNIEEDVSGKIKNLPQGNLSKTFEFENTIIAEIDEDGKLFLNGKQIQNDLDTIKNNISNPKETSFVLIIDENAPYEAFGEFMGNIEKAGVIKISFIE